jgi:hypothetical protein
MRPRRGQRRRHKIARLKQQRLFPHEDIADEATADGVDHTDKNAGRDGKPCLKGFARSHHAVGRKTKRIKNEEWLG